MTKADLKQTPTGQWMLRDPRTGQYVELRGANSMKASDLPLRKEIDLTKPIAAQALHAGSGSQKSK
jgi:hypothetical protein